MESVSHVWYVQHLASNMSGDRLPASLPQMSLTSPSLHLELIEEILLRAHDRHVIAQCRLVCKGIKNRIDDNSELQLPLFAQRCKITSPNISKPGYQRYSFHNELRRLQSIEEQQSKLLYGQQYPQTQTLQVATTNADMVDIFAVANGYVFLPLKSPGAAGITGIARYRLDAFDQPPDFLNFGRIIRHFQTDAMEDVLFVMLLLEDE